MTKRRKKTVALMIAAVGIGVVVVASIVLHRPIREQHWIWKLETGTGPERIRAVERLASLGSVKAIPALVKAAAAALMNAGGGWAIKIYERGSSVPVPNYFSGRISKVVTGRKLDSLECLNALRRILKSGKTDAERALKLCLKAQEETAKAIAACALFEAGRRVKDYVPGKRTIWIEDGALQ